MQINDDGGTPGSGSGSGDSAPLQKLTIRAVGSRAILIELSGMDEVLALKSALTELPLPGQVDVLAAAETVMVTADSTVAIRSIAEQIQHLDLTGSTTLDDTLRVIETVYDGEDLDAVAELTGLSRDGVIEAHTAQIWTAAFGGFAPGFAYLVGENQRLEVPRRESPRTAVPAGSVALAGNFSAIYPRQSPGGWQLIGRTSARMWDLDREQPALVVPGNRVQYKAVRQLVETGASDEGNEPTQEEGASGKETASQASATTEGSAVRERHESQSGVRVVSPGAQSLIQDLGRFGYADLGVSEAGALDSGAMRTANRLAGNGPNEAVIETAMGGLSVTAQGDQVLAVAGAPSDLKIRNPDGMVRSIPMGAPFALLDGETLTLGAPTRGLRSYVAFRGGIDVPLVLGSRATDTMSGIGPEPLAAQSFVPVAKAPPTSVVGIPRTPDDVVTAAERESVQLNIVLGPRADWFDQPAIDSLTGQEWEVTAKSSRVGIRLDGTPLERSRQGELPSEGTLAGSIQIPPSGMPVLFLADHPVTGGYPVIGVVAHEHLDRAAQIPPGGRIRFHAVAAPDEDTSSANTAGTGEAAGPADADETET